MKLAILDHREKGDIQECKVRLVLTELQGRKATKAREERGDQTEPATNKSNLK